MYKILIKYSSRMGKTFWQSYELLQEDNTYVEFSTDDIDVLKEETRNLGNEIGFDMIRIIKDIDYHILVDISESIDLENAEVATSEDVTDLYSAAFNNVFGGE